MKIVITMRTHAESMTPERAEKTHGYVPGFAKLVRKQIKAAKNINSNSKWGWCVIEVVANVLVEGIVLKGSVTLDQCSYTSELDFVRNSEGYFDAMMNDAVRNAIKKFNAGMARAVGKKLLKPTGTRKARGSAKPRGRGAG